LLYCEALYFHSVLISRFWNIDILLRFSLAVLYWYLGNLNFCGYLILLP